MFYHAMASLDVLDLTTLYNKQNELKEKKLKTDLLTDSSHNAK